MIATATMNNSTLTAGAFKKVGLDFRAIYDQYAAKIYGKCLKMLRDEYAAEDVCQDILMKVFQNLAKFEKKSKFSTWVYAITHNSCVDYLRKKKRKKKQEEERKIYMTRLGRPEHGIQEKNERKSAELQEVMAQISFSDEEILRMKYELGMSIRDIAEELGKSESAVKMKILRAKNKARRVRLELFSHN
jgi:RNA polymerase sigma factor (sigma-70 family)